MYKIIESLLPGVSLKSCSKYNGGAAGKGNTVKTLTALGKQGLIAQSENLENQYKIVVSIMLQGKDSAGGWALHELGVYCAARHIKGSTLFPQVCSQISKDADGWKGRDT